MVLALDMPTQPNGGAAYQKFMLGIIVFALTIAMSDPLVVTQYTPYSWVVSNQAWTFSSVASSNKAEVSMI